MSIDKLFKKEPEKKNTLEILLKIFLIVGTLAGVCVILKYAYDKYKNSGCCLCDCDDDDFDDDILDECECCCDDCEDCDKTCEDCAEEQPVEEEAAAEEPASTDAE